MGLPAEHLTPAETVNRFFPLTGVVDVYEELPVEPVRVPDEVLAGGAQLAEALLQGVRVHHHGLEREVHLRVNLGREENKSSMSTAICNFCCDEFVCSEDSSFVISIQLYIETFQYFLGLEEKVG